MCVYWLVLQRIRTPLVQSEFRIKTVGFIIGSFVSSFTKSVKLSLYKPPPESHRVTGRCSVRCERARYTHTHTLASFDKYKLSATVASLRDWRSERAAAAYDSIAASIWGDTHMIDRFISLVGYLSRAHNVCKADGSATSKEWRRVRRIYSLTGHRVSKTNLSFGRLDNNRIYPRQPLP